MRFNILAACAVFGPAAVQSISIPKRSWITDVGTWVSSILNSTGIDAAEAELNTLTGGKLVEFENKLGISYAERILGLSTNNATVGYIQELGEAIVLYLDGYGLEELDEWLVNVTDGGILAFEKVAGIADIREALGIEQPGDQLE